MPATPAQLAAQAAEAIRSLNHATLPSAQGDEDWQHPGDAYNVVGNLTQMAMTLPQAIDQITRLIVDLHENGHLRSDKNQLEHDLDETVRGLEEARIAANKLYGTLNRAHSGLSPIAYKD